MAAAGIRARGFAGDGCGHALARGAFPGGCWTSEAGRDGGSGTGGGFRHRAAAGRGFSRHEPRCRRERGSRARADGWQRPSRVAAPDRRRRVRAADGVREPGQPAARPQHRPAAGDGHPLRTRRRPPPPRSADPRRNDPAVARRRRRGAGVHASRHCCPPRARAAGDSADQRGGAQRCGGRVHLRPLAAHRHADRPRSGIRRIALARAGSH